MMLWGCANIAHAQLRSIPPDTERAYMRYLHENVIELNGKPEKLAPGIRIRDTANRIITPTSVPPFALVKYRRDASGAVREVWILTPQEAEQR
jgi:hypothetical protein